MLADRVEPGALAEVHLECQPLLCGRRKQPVRPPAMVKEPVHVVRFPVQEDFGDAVRVRPHLHTADAEVSLHTIPYAAWRPYRNLQIVEMWRFRRPKSHIWNHQRERLRQIHHRPSHYFTPTVHHSNIASTSAGCSDRHGHGTIQPVAINAIVGYMDTRYRLHPDRLPDAGAAPVEAVVERGERLLARGLSTPGWIVCGIPYAHHQLVLAVFQEVRDIDGERQDAASMRHVHGLRAVHEDLRAVIYASEMQHRPRAVH